jgi:hypothetical protein
MLITVRGWGRNSGETTIVDASLMGAEAEADRYSEGETYLQVQHLTEFWPWAGVRISTSTKVRLGGKYLLQIKLSKEEIRELFFKTHDGEIVRMFQSLVEDEATKERLRLFRDNFKLRQPEPEPEPQRKADVDDIARVFGGDTAAEDQPDLPDEDQPARSS